jgi:hypothetical protein
MSVKALRMRASSSEYSPAASNWSLPSTAVTANQRPSAA